MCNKMLVCKVPFPQHVDVNCTFSPYVACEGFPRDTKISLELPKRLPRGLKRLPRSTKRAPRRSQEVPKRVL